MSAVAQVDREEKPNGLVCLVKGSPEAVRNLLLKDAVPEWYDKTYREMAEHGLRVLALAYRWCDGSEKELKAAEGPARTWVESDLSFGGFLAFGCKTRADSGVVLRCLHEADVAIAMITGDAPLTALHVAKDTSICAEEDVKPCLLLEQTPEGGVHWAQAIGEDRKTQPSNSPGVVKLNDTHDLMV